MGVCIESMSIGLVGFVEAGSLPFAWLLSLVSICTGREVLALFFPPDLVADVGRVVVLLLLAASDGPLDWGSGFPRRMFVIMACKASPFFSTARRSCLSVVAASRLMYPLTIRSASAKRMLNALASSARKLVKEAPIDSGGFGGEYWQLASQIGSAFACVLLWWWLGGPVRTISTSGRVELTGGREGQEPASVEDWGGMSK